MLGYDFYGSKLNGQPEASWGSGVLDEISMVVDLAQEYGKIAAFTERGAAKGMADGYACDFWSQNMLGRAVASQLAQTPPVEIRTVPAPIATIRSPASFSELASPTSRRPSPSTPRATP